MPYKNIVFIKLEKRLLNDHRWFTLSEESQLNFIKLILIAGHTQNKIPKTLTVIKDLFRSKQDLTTIARSIIEIRKNFHKLKQTKSFYYFEDFESYTNYIPKEIPRKSQGTPKDALDKEKEEDKEKSKRTLPDSEFLLGLKTLYPYVDTDTELTKIDGWLSVNPHRKKTRRFIINWFNRIDKPIATNNTGRLA